MNLHSVHFAVKYSSGSTELHCRELECKVHLVQFQFKSPKSVLNLAAVDSADLKMQSFAIGIK